MAESSLSLGYPDFCSEVGYFLGYGRDTISSPTKWSADQQVDIPLVVNAGYRQFLYPPAIPGVPQHEWTFLKPWTTLATTASDYDTDLPDNFGNLVGEIRYTGSDNQSGPVTHVHVSKLLALKEGNSTSGAPTLCSIRPKAATAGSTGQRWEILFWPTPDATYTLLYQYQVLVSQLTNAAPYPLGGMRHGEAIMASCLAVAEERMNDERGVRFAKFVEMLNQSIVVDRRMGPEYFGYNGDREGRRPGRKPLPGNASYEGVTYP